ETDHEAEQRGQPGNEDRFYKDAEIEGLERPDIVGKRPADIDAGQPLVLTEAVGPHDRERSEEEGQHPGDGWAYSFGENQGLTGVDISGTLANNVRALQPLYLGIFIKSVFVA